MIWRITDVHVAAKNAAETIKPSGTDVRNNLENISALCNDVLKQAEASLAAFIGGVNYSDQFAVAAAVQSRDLPEFDDGERGGKPPARTKARASSLFDVDKLASCVEHANKVANTYGVTIISINVIGAAPADDKLQTTLAQGAVAAAVWLCVCACVLCACVCVYVCVCGPGDSADLARCNVQTIADGS